MGFHATEVCELPAIRTGRLRNHRAHHRATLRASVPGKPTPTRKNRVWDFFGTFTKCAGNFASQPVASVSETSLTLAITVSGVRYYGYRYYSPGLGRWISRDPAEENGRSLGLYVIAGNNLNDFVDTDGRASFPWGTGGGATPPSIIDVYYNGDAFLPNSAPVLPPDLPLPGTAIVTDDAGRKCCGGALKTVYLKAVMMARYQAHFIGHVFVQTPSVARGYYPINQHLPHGIGDIVHGNDDLLGPGRVQNDNADVRDGITIIYATYKACPRSVQILEQMLGDPRDTGTYDLLNIFGRNCVGWAFLQIEQSGFIPPYPPTQAGLAPPIL